MPDMHSAVMPLVALFVAFVIMTVALFLTRKIARWLDLRFFRRHRADLPHEEAGDQDINEQTDGEMEQHKPDSHPLE